MDEKSKVGKLLDHLTDTVCFLPVSHQLAAKVGWAKVRYGIALFVHNGAHPSINRLLEELCAEFGVDEAEVRREAGRRVGCEAV